MSTKEWEDPPTGSPAARWKGKIYSVGDRHSDVTALIWSQVDDAEKVELETGHGLEFGWLFPSGAFVTIDEVTP
jgi:hypothetical protein